MRGLILKDWLVLKKVGKVFFILDLMLYIFALVKPDNLFFLLFPNVTSSALVMNLMSYEAADHWNRYVKTLPCSPSDIVSSKYILVLVYAAITAAASSLILAIQMLNQNAWDLSAWVSFTVLFMMISLVSNAFLLPFVFRFGLNTGKIAYYVVIGVGAFIMVEMDSQIVNSIVRVSQWVLSLIMAAGSILLYFVSWKLSILFYGQNKEKV